MVASTIKPKESILIVSREGMRLPYRRAITEGMFNKFEFREQPYSGKPADYNFIEAGSMQQAIAALKDPHYDIRLIVAGEEFPLWGDEERNAKMLENKKPARGMHLIDFIRGGKLHNDVSSAVGSLYAADGLASKKQISMSAIEYTHMKELKTKFEKTYKNTPIIYIAEPLSERKIAELKAACSVRVLTTAESAAINNLSDAEMPDVKALEIAPNTSIVKKDAFVVADEVTRNYAKMLPPPHADLERVQSPGTVINSREIVNAQTQRTP